MLLGWGRSAQVRVTVCGLGSWMNLVENPYSTDRPRPGSYTARPSPAMPHFRFDMADLETSAVIR